MVKIHQVYLTLSVAVKKLHRNSRLYAYTAGVGAPIYDSILIKAATSQTQARISCQNNLHQSLFNNVLKNKFKNLHF